MTIPEGAQLARGIRRHSGEFRKLCEGLDEETASRAPGDRWSPKQVVSHLCGPEGSGFMPSFRAILDQDNPRLDIEVDNPFFTGKRTSMTMAGLLAEFESEYGRLAELVEGLTSEQLDRKVHIPILKGTPLGEHTTLAGWIEALSEYHLVFHIDHMKEILEELGVKS
ncbi:MAG TPA: DinB family protein [Geobacteraceae bacterium]|nr:DinB family protein [Geobacteraceae bacterium]